MLRGACVGPVHALPRHAWPERRPRRAPAVENNYFSTLVTTQRGAITSPAAPVTSAQGEAASPAANINGVSTAGCRVTATTAALSALFFTRLGRREPSPNSMTSALLAADGRAPCVLLLVPHTQLSCSEHDISLLPTSAAGCMSPVGLATESVPIGDATSYYHRALEVALAAISRLWPRLCSSMWQYGCALRACKHVRAAHCRCALKHRTRATLLCDSLG